MLSISTGRKSEGYRVPDAISKAHELADKAITPFTNAVLAQPRSVEHLTNLATAHLRLENFDECRRYCSLAINVNGHYKYADYRHLNSYILEIEKEETCGHTAIVEKRKQEVYDFCMNLSYVPDDSIRSFKRLYNEVLNWKL